LKQEKNKTADRWAAARGPSQYGYLKFEKNLKISRLRFCQKESKIELPDGPRAKVCDSTVFID